MRAQCWVGTDEKGEQNGIFEEGEHGTPLDNGGEELVKVLKMKGQVVRKGAKVKNKVLFTPFFFTLFRKSKKIWALWSSVSGCLKIREIKPKPCDFKEKIPGELT